MIQLDLPAEGLTGRVRELGFLQEFFRQAAVSGGALLLSGDPGVGKTALLDALAGAAAGSGATVLRAAGAEFEGDVSFAGLNQALFPLLGEFGGLGAAHREALRVALGFGAGPAPDRLLVSGAALALLRHVAARGPLLLIVLSYVAGTPALYGFAARNGRTLADNTPEAMLSLVTGTAVPSGLKPSAARGQRSSHFPTSCPSDSVLQLTGAASGPPGCFPCGPDAFSSRRSWYRSAIWMSAGTPLSAATVAPAA